MNWNNVNDKLPEIEQDVLACCSNNEYFVAYMYNNTDWYDTNDGSLIIGVNFWCEITPPDKNNCLKSDVVSPDCLFKGNKEDECWKVLGRCVICEHSKWYK